MAMVTRIPRITAHSWSIAPSWTPTKTGWVTNATMMMTTMGSRMFYHQVQTTAAWYQILTRLMTTVSFRMPPDEVMFRCFGWKASWCWTITRHSYSWTSLFSLNCYSHYLCTFSVALFHTHADQAVANLEQIKWQFCEEKKNILRA